MICSVKPRDVNCELFVSVQSGIVKALEALITAASFQMTILLRMDDKMNRQLTCPISQDDSAVMLSHELVHLGFIHEVTIRNYCYPRRRVAVIIPQGH